MSSPAAPLRSTIRLLSGRARALNARAGMPPLPALFLFSDPERLPDPADAARRLPRGAAIIYRPLGAADRLAVARRLREITRRRGQILLIGGDENLAAATYADGLHLPERALNQTTALRRRRPSWLFTAAAHTPKAIAAAARLGANAAILSPIFATASHPDARPLGPRRAFAWASGAAIPVIALGGLDAHTITRLRGPFAGVGAIGALAGAAN